MIAQIVTRCEVQLSYKEQKMLEEVIKWADESLQDENMPEGIQEILADIADGISHLLRLVPEKS